MQYIFISILFVLVIPIVILSIFARKLWNKNQEIISNHSSEVKELNKEIGLLKKSNRTWQLEREEELENKAKNKLKNIENLININVGDKGLYGNYPLIWG